jgi:hypothetical protein
MNEADVNTARCRKLFEEGLKEQALVQGHLNKSFLVK